MFTTKANVILYRRQDKETCDFIRQNLITSCELSVHGSLDHMSDSEIENMAAQNPATGVPVYLSNGSTIYADHDQLDETVFQLALKLQSQEPAPLVMFCTIPWPRLATIKNIVRPSDVMEALASAMTSPKGSIGVVQPDPITAKVELMHWQAMPYRIESVCADADTPDRFSEAISSLVSKEVDTVVLDCLGYTQVHLKQARRITDKPIVFPMDLIGKTLDSLFM